MCDKQTQLSIRHAFGYLDRNTSLHCIALCNTDEKLFTYYTVERLQAIQMNRSSAVWSMKSLLPNDTESLAQSAAYYLIIKLLIYRSTSTHICIHALQVFYAMTRLNETNKTYRRSDCTETLPMTPFSTK